MATYTIPATTTRISSLGDEGAQAISDYLMSHDPPYTVAGVSLRIWPSPAVVIEADRDPAPALAAWNPPPTRDDLAREKLWQAIGAIRSGASDALTAAQWRERVEETLVALAWLALRVGEDE